MLGHRKPIVIRSVPIPGWLWRSALVLAIGFAVLAGSFVLLIRRYMREFDTKDTLTVMPWQVYEAVRANPAIDRKQLMLHIKRVLVDGSVCNFSFDDDLNPLDGWGNRIEVNYTIKNNRIFVRCRSDGRDGIPGTEDDIVGETEGDLAPEK